LTAEGNIVYLCNNAERTHCCVYMVKRDSCMLLTATLDSTIQRETHCFLSIVISTGHNIMSYLHSTSFSPLLQE